MLRSRTLALLTITGLAAFTAGCGGDDGGSGGGGAPQSTQTQTQSTQTQTQSTPSETTQSQSGGSGASASADGKAIFTENCSRCHTLPPPHPPGEGGANL